MTTTPIKPKIAILASGNGTNAEHIARYLASRGSVDVAQVISNKDNAPVVQRMRRLGIEVATISDPNAWRNPTDICRQLQAQDVDLIVLAGFLAIIREPLIGTFSGRIVNIHPSLLPKHGGPGMWGIHVHEAVLASGDTESGITIHLVTAAIDGGTIVEQHSCPVLAGDTPETLANRVHGLEYEFFPAAVERLAIEAASKRREK